DRAHFNTRFAGVLKSVIVMRGIPLKVESSSYVPPIGGGTFTTLPPLFTSYCALLIPPVSSATSAPEIATGLVPPLSYPRSGKASGPLSCGPPIAKAKEWLLELSPTAIAVIVGFANVPPGSSAGGVYLALTLGDPTALSDPQSGLHGTPDTV